MRIVSINVSRPRLVMWNGRSVSTGIYKTPVAGPVMLSTLNLDGDRQADLTVHGGPAKAAYAYPVEHYDFWREEFPELELPWGMFGENFTLEGLNEADVNIGDSFRLGGAEVVVTEPRMPCFKLGIKFWAHGHTAKISGQRQDRVLFLGQTRGNCRSGRAGPVNRARSEQRDCI